MSVMVIVLSLGFLGIIVGVAYWFAREEQKTIRSSRRGQNRQADAEN
jgi:hypothetical protein